MSDRDRYDKYVAWCRQNGIRPAWFRDWMRGNSKLNDMQYSYTERRKPRQGKVG